MRIENRNGLVVDTELVLCSGKAEPDAALDMTGRIDGDERVTVGADKGYDTRGFVQEMRDRNMTPTCRRISIDRAVAQSTGARSSMPDTR